MVDIREAWEVNLCRQCAHARKTPGKERRLCMFTGERFPDDRPAGGCAGWMPGYWDEKKELPRRGKPGQFKPHDYVRNKKTMPEKMEQVKH